MFVQQLQNLFTFDKCRCGGNHSFAAMSCFRTNSTSQSSNNKSLLMQKPKYTHQFVRTANQVMLLSFLGATSISLPTDAQSIGNPTLNRQTPLQAPAVPTPMPPSSAVPVPQDNGYLLGPGDRVRLDVFSAPEYSGEYQVLSDGSLNVPLIGATSIQGMGVTQASKLLSSKFASYLRQPIITVSLLIARPVKIAISGAVQRPGSYTASPIGATTPTGNTSNSVNTVIPTVTRMIQLAGGITQSADVRNIEVHRAQSATNSQELPKIEKVDLWQLLQKGDSTQDFLLRDGDSIIVPTATALSNREITELATASFSPAQITVNVVGEVGTPGAVQVPPNTPLNQALLAAGGFNRRAKKRSVDFVRLNPDGTVSKRSITIDLAQGINEQNNPPLRNNDTIVVNRSGLAGLSDAFGFLAPVSGVFNILRVIGGN
ncbi:MAG: SLBB domain-containing protein [Phormidesmis sp. CAN_BIN44]|nr:SLBB domain-containing protein [Phormidesmis sp. CAN_BIN44]